jgi:NADPH:quinone reductase-like Zn-dependent oxidoreductase
MGRKSLKKLATFIEEGKMKPVVDSVYDMDQAQQVR